MADQFKETLNIFRSFVQYTQPLTWDEWAALNDSEQQVAVLYCQFYDQITLAWYKAKADFVPDEDGVSCVLQYLNKNVPIILAEENKFTPAYIYRVSYNCMDCLRYVQRDINRSKLETTNVTYYDGEELDLCDLVPHKDMSYEDRMTKAAFWSIIKEMGAEAEKVVNHLLNGVYDKDGNWQGESLRRVSKRSKAYGVDPLTDVSVSEEQCEQIIGQLRERLAGFKAVYY